MRFSGEGTGFRMIVLKGDPERLIEVKKKEGSR
jgi:hypothetical protein